MASQQASITRLGHGIAAIDTEYSRPLQDASHLIFENGRAAFVDTGANNAVPLLLDGLRQHDLDPGDVDFLFLTHVHLDHAGGAGLLMKSLPNATCVLHPRGAPHMIDPTKLILGTEAVYGKEESRRIYGTIEPVAKDRIAIADDEQWFDFNGRALQTIYTEGHARHHYVINDPASRGVFTGDSFGISYRELDTAAGPFIFPSATPIDFDPEGAHRAYERILACDPERVYLTHYSQVDELDRLAMDLHAGIDAYVQMAIDCEHAEDRLAALEEAMFEFFVDGLDRHGFKGERDSARAILDIDVTLNAQGLSVWLDRRSKKR